MKGLIILLFSIIPITLKANTISPLEFGLSDAQSDVDRYLVLLKTHQEALKTGSKFIPFQISTRIKLFLCDVHLLLSLHTSKHIQILRAVGHIQFQSLEVSLLT